MKIALVFLCFLAGAYCQILSTGNTPEEGVPIYEEIKVESVLTVRSKSGSRTGKSSSDLARNATDGVIGRRTRSTELREAAPAVDRTREEYVARRGISPKFTLNLQGPDAE